MDGWISLHRKLLENPIFLKPELLQLFVYCLFRANYHDAEFIFNNKMEEVPRGSFITGREVLASELKQNPITTYKRLKLLETLGYISIKSNNKFTLITVIKYNTYQPDSFKKEQPDNNKGTTKEQPENTNNNINNINKDHDPHQVLLNILKSVNNYPFNEEKDVNLIVELENDYPDIDFVEALKSWKTYKVDKPLDKKSNPRSQIRTWIKKGSEWGQYKKKVNQVDDGLSDWEKQNAEETRRMREELEETKPKSIDEVLNRFKEV